MLVHLASRLRLCGDVARRCRCQLPVAMHGHSSLRPRSAQVFAPASTRSEVAQLRLDEPWERGGSEVWPGGRRCLPERLVCLEPLSSRYAGRSIFRDKGLASAYLSVASGVSVDETLEIEASTCALRGWEWSVKSLRRWKRFQSQRWWRL